MSWLDPIEPSDDALAQLLTTWRTELDGHAATAMSTEPPVIPSRSRRWVRAHQRTAVATAMVVAIAGSTSVAAAVTGPSGPLGGVHNLFWGPTPATKAPDSVAKRVDHALDKAGADIRAAQDVGSITASGREELNAELDRAQTLINGDPAAPAALQARLDGLRAELAAIPTSTPPSTTSQHRGHGGGSPGDDQTGRSGEGRQGSDDGSSGDDSQNDDSQGGDNAGPSGSDDGTHSGSQDGDGGGSDDTVSGDQQDRSGSQDGEDTTSGGDGESDGGDESGSDGIGSSGEG